MVQQGQYILDRWMVSIIRDMCAARGISFVSYSDDWLIELSHGGKTRRIIGYKFDVNNSVASTIAGDKVAAYQILQNSNIPAVEHRLVRTKAGDYTDWNSGPGKVVIKPLDGTSGHGVALLKGPEAVAAYIQASPTIASWAVSPYLDIASEQRLVVLDNEVICSYEKQPVQIDGLAMFNLGLGAKPSIIEPSTANAEMAIRAVKSLGLRLAAVDIILVDDTYMVLEVNDGIMMENFMRQSQENKDIAHDVYDRIISAQFA